VTGETNTSLVIPNFPLSRAGVYNIEIMNGGGYVFGTGAVINARIPLQIISQPQNQTNIVLGATTNFPISAISQTTDPAHVSQTKYQWYFNGSPLNVATNPTLTITNVQFSNGGTYYCVVRDDGYGDVLTSDLVTLTPISKPGIVVQPVSFVAVEGGNAYFSLVSTGSTPMTIRWRAQTNGAGVVGNLTSVPVINGTTNSVLIFTNLAYTTNILRISAVTTNLAGNAPVSASVTLTILKDSDHDGLPDLLETNRAGFNINDPSDGARDDDGDGMSNAAEYIAGTDYSNSNSVLRIQTLSPGIGRLQFTAVSNRTYTVQYTDSLNPAAWRKLADVLGRSTTRTENITDPNATTNRFYRLVIPIQP